MSDFDVSIMGGADVSRMRAEPSPSRGGPSPRDSEDRGSGDDDSDTKSVCSVGSHYSQSGHGKHGSRAHHLSVGECLIDLEQQEKGHITDKLNTSLCTDFHQLCIDGSESHATGLLKSLEMYGWDKPNKLQQHVIPITLRFLGKRLAGQSGDHASAGKGRSCIQVQGPAQAGKTSGVLLGVLASIDVEARMPQAIMISRSPKQDIDKFLRVFALMQDVNYQAFNEALKNASAESPEVKAAQSAHILIGHPTHVANVLSLPGAPIPLNHVKVLVVDDAHELFHGSAAARSDSRAPTASNLTLKGLPSGDKRSSPISSPPPISSPSPGPGGEGGDQEQANPGASLEDVVRIVHAVEAKQYSGNLRHVIMSDVITDKGSKKLMKLLKSSLLSKKNLLGVDNMPLPTKVIKAMKHYYAVATRSDWVRIFSGLVKTLSFPRALIYCDTDFIGKYFQEMQDQGVAVSANLPGASTEVRQKALQDFTHNKTQFLITHSEPAVCQVVLPKVSCVFHFGIPTQNPTVYGVRLLPLEEKLAASSASIIVVDAPRRAGKEKVPSIVSKLEKKFGVSFMDMPLEFLPNSASTNHAPRSGRSEADPSRYKTS